MSQLNIPLSEETLQNISHQLRPIHYLGSKLRILEFLREVVEDIAPGPRRLCDLFSGSGTVAQCIAQSRPVTSVDVQEYSRVLCHALLVSSPTHISSRDIEDEIRASRKLSGLGCALRPLIELESHACSDAGNNPNLICNILEQGSIVSFERGYKKIESRELLQALKASAISLESFRKETGALALISRHYGGIYFSYKQAAELDAILDYVNSRGGLRDFLLAPLLSTASEAVNTVGKQFAQPLRPRNRDGKPKSNLAGRLGKDRSVDVIKSYTAWLSKYSNLNPGDFDHKILRLDYLDALKTECRDVSVVYADPPYTRDHYSRFYHALETICLNDDPQISTTKIGGSLRLSRGLYRLDRHQSDFCIRSRAPGAFNDLFGEVAKLAVPLILSYSPYEEKEGVHPRVMTIEALTDLGGKYFSSCEMLDPGTFSHSKLNHTDKNFGKNDKGEILLVFK